MMQSGEQVESAESVQDLISQIRASLRSKDTVHTIIVKEQQLNSLAGFVQRANNALRAEFSIQDNHVEILASYKIRTLFNHVFLNVSFQVLPADRLVVSNVKVGELHLPSWLFLKIVEWTLNSQTNTALASKSLNTISAISLKDKEITMTLGSLAPLLAEIEKIDTGENPENNKVLTRKVAHYLRFLEGLQDPLILVPSQSASLAYYVHKVMGEAKVRSSNYSPMLENEAAILAMAVYLGSPRFSTLIGDLSKNLGRAVPYIRNKPTLLKRRDLSLHFIFSAAIKLLSEKEISIAVGEFKELMDRAEGGSGYSFVDLAADLSGAHFAALAVDPKHAHLIQTILSLNEDESLFMVDVEGFDEGLTKSEFAQKYRQVDSEEYRNALAIINQRIANLAISKELINTTHPKIE